MWGGALNTYVSKCACAHTRLYTYLHIPAALVLDWAGAEAGVEGEGRKVLGGAVLHALLFKRAVDNDKAPMPAFVDFRRIHGRIALGSAVYVDKVRASQTFIEDGPPMVCGRGHTPWHFTLLRENANLAESRGLNNKIVLEDPPIRALKIRPEGCAIEPLVLVQVLRGDFCYPPGVES